MPNEITYTQIGDYLLREIDEAAQTRLATIGDREIAHEIIVSELVCR
jgi:hypothetical protein